MNGGWSRLRSLPGAGANLPLLLAWISLSFCNRGLKVTVAMVSVGKGEYGFKMNGNGRMKGRTVNTIISGFLYRACFVLVIVLVLASHSVIHVRVAGATTSTVRRGPDDLADGSADGFAQDTLHDGTAGGNPGAPLLQKGSGRLMVVGRVMLVWDGYCGRYQTVTDGLQVVITQWERGPKALVRAVTDANGYFFVENIPGPARCWYACVNYGGYTVPVPVRIFSTPGEPLAGKYISDVTAVVYDRSATRRLLDLREVALIVNKDGEVGVRIRESLSREPRFSYTIGDSDFEGCGAESLYSVKYFLDTYGLEPWRACLVEKHTRDEARALSNLAGEQREEGDLPGTLETCRKALEKDPDNQAAARQITGILEELGRMEEAELFLRERIGKKPQLLYCRSDLAGFLFDHKRYRAAADVLLEAKTSWPRDTALLRKLGDCFEALEEYTRAVGCYEEVLEIEPDSWGVPGRIFELMRPLSWKEKLTVIERRLSRNPYSGELWQHFASLYVEQNLFDEAEAYLGERLLREPDSVGVRVDAAMLRAKMGRYTEAAATLLEAAKMSEQPDNLLWKLRTLAREDWDTGAKIEWLEKFLPLFEDETGVKALLVPLYRARGQREKAESCLRESIERHPGQTQPYTQLAEILAGGGQFEEAEKVLLEAMEGMGENKSAWWLAESLRGILKKDPEPERVIETTRRWLAARPEMDDIRWVLVVTLKEQDRYEEAADCMLEGVKAGRDTEDFLCSLGQCYEKLGKTGLAIEAFVNALAEEPGHSSAPEALCALVRRETDPGKQIAVLEKAISIKPDEDDISLLLAEIYSMQGRAEAVIRVLQEAVALRPGNGPLRNGAISLLARTGQYQAAARLVVDKVEQYPDTFAHAYQAWSEVLWKAGKEDLSLRFARQLLEGDRENYKDKKCKLTLSEEFRKRNDITRAESVYRQALSLFPDHADSYRHLAEFYRRNGFLDRLEAICREAIGLFPHDKELTEFLADHYKKQERFDDLVECCLQWLARNPGNTDMHYEIIKHLYEAGKLDEAVPLIRKKVAEDGAAFSYCGEKFGVVLWQTGNRDLSLKYALELLEEDEERYKDYWDKNVLVLEYLRRGMTAEAVAVHQRAVELAPDMSRNFRHLGELYMELGSLDQAVSALRRAFSLDRFDTRTSRMLARCLWQMDDIRGGLAVHREVLDYMKKRGLSEKWIYENAADFYTRAEEFEQALSCCREMVNCCPDYGYFRVKLALAYLRTGNRPLAESEFEIALELSPGYKPTVSIAAWYYEHSDRAGRAVEVLLKAKEIDPECADLSLTLAGVYERMGKLDEAVAECEAVLKIDPFERRAHTMLGRIYRERGDEQRAAAEFGHEERHLRRQIAINPFDYRSFSRLARVLAMDGRDLDGALKMAQKALGLKHGSHNMETLGLVHYARSNYERAVEAFSQGAKAGLNEPSCLYYLSMALCKGGKPDRAQEVFSLAVRLNPIAPLRREAEEVLSR